MEAQTPTKDEESEARLFFDEIRIIPFGEQRLPYTQQHVALRFRDAFLKKFSVADEHRKQRTEDHGAVAKKMFEAWIKPQGGSKWKKQRGKVWRSTEEWPQQWRW